MKKDYSDETKKLIKKYKKEDIKYLKPIEYLSKRNQMTKEQMDGKIINLNDLKYTEKQEKPSGTRYALFFIHSTIKGHCYVLEFDKNIKVATIYPLGRRTIRRYKKKRFKI